MELSEALRRRRMVRSFAGRPLAPGQAEQLVSTSLGAPSAGNAAGTAWVILEGPEETTRYWQATTTAAWRASSRRWPGLSRAPVVAVSLCSPGRYLDRYSEPDKARAGLGHPVAPGAAREAPGTAAWPVPYWFGDAAFAVMALLLAVTDAGLGACFLGNFRGEDTLVAVLGAPDGWRVFGAVAFGHPDDLDHRSASLTRPSPRDRLHRGRWNGTVEAASGG